MAMAPSVVSQATSVNSSQSTESQFVNSNSIANNLSSVKTEVACMTVSTGTTADFGIINNDDMLTNMKCDSFIDNSNNSVTGGAVLGCTTTGAVASKTESCVNSQGHLLNGSVLTNGNISTPSTIGTNTQTGDLQATTLSMVSF